MTELKDRLSVPLTPEDLQAYTEHIDKLKPLEQIHALEDLLDAIDEKIDAAERADKHRH